MRLEESSGDDLLRGAVEDDVFEFPTSFAQQRLWFVDRLLPGNAAYNIHAAFPIDAPVDAEALAVAVHAVASRHDTLRTGFDERDGVPVQIVHDSSRLQLRVCDHRGAADARDDALREAADDAATPFDLSAAPLARITLHVLSPAQHLLALTVHHIIADAWSMGVLLREVTAAYTAVVTGRPADLPDLPLQYCDYAVWQEEQLADPDGVGIEHWRRHLLGAEPIRLPFDRPRSNVPALAGATHRWRFDAGLSNSIGEIARRHQCTPFVVLLAAFAALAHRVGPQDDVVVGVPTAGRELPELELLIGFFVNILPIRVDLSGNPTFADLLARTRTAVLGGFAHGDVPFERIVEAVGVDRDVSHHPLFQVTFQLHESAEGAEAARTIADGAAATASTGGIAETERRTTNYDLAIEMWWHGGRLHGRATYATALFDAATIEQLVVRFEHLLDAVVTDADAHIDGVSLLSDDELAQLDAWNATGSGPPGHPLVHELFEQWVDRDPAAIAITCTGAAPLTYGEVEARANRLAHRLVRAGVHRDGCVAVVADRSPALVVALLAVWKAGGAYVGIDPHDPPARVADLVERAGASIVLADAAGRAACASTRAEVLEIADPRRGSASRPSRRRGATDEDLAYVSFTSGSTGVPKGVAVTHAAVSRLVRENRFHRFVPGETMLHASPVAFDASTLELWGPLTNGGTLAVQPAGPSLAELAETIVRHDVDTLWMTAGLFHQMVDEELQAFAGVSTVLAGGDVLSAAHVRRVLEVPGAREVIDGYGPTENTTFTCCHVMTDPAQVPDDVPIGRPIGGTTVHVLDARRRPVPIGVPGELWIGGVGLARGYVGDPEAAADAFVAGPFEHIRAPRLYRTGDLVRFLRDGSLQFIGRIDRQVKVRGFRIEPAGVEAALLAVPSVRQAVVEAVDGVDGRTLHGFVVVRDGEAGADPAGLRRHLEQHLPPHAVPSRIHILDEVPLTANGKVDRTRLALLARTTTSGREAEPPRTELEEAVAALFADVLDRPAVSVHDDFFADLGGHSLLGTRLVARLRSAFEIELPLRTLFEHPTVAGMAAAIEDILLTEIESLEGGAVQG
ncbi:amino acid adenylation domain-containing protein [Microbacterium sp. NPDC019599]|uniref:non-ribosomal peptide synthetase n=1 Tax=Microbacterium sp. NPDC019599 TaxID=3154690 RepID=UPI0033E13A76